MKAHKLKLQLQLSIRYMLNLRCIKFFPICMACTILSSTVLACDDVCSIKNKTKGLGQERPSNQKVLLERSSKKVPQPQAKAAVVTKDSMNKKQQ